MRSPETAKRSSREGCSLLIATFLAALVNLAAGKLLFSDKALTLVKTCEPVAEMRECKASRDWSLLALQNVRTGKSHYLVICRCPDTNILEGPMRHDQPTYASVPGIRVYGMMCVQRNRRGRPLRHVRSLFGLPDPEMKIAKANFPWHLVPELMATSNWD